MFAIVPPPIVNVAAPAHPPRNRTTISIEIEIDSAQPIVNPTNKMLQVWELMERPQIPEAGENSLR